jgi:hypothetical protein
MFNKKLIYLYIFTNIKTYTSMDLGDRLPINPIQGSESENNSENELSNIENELISKKKKNENKKKKNDQAIKEEKTFIEEYEKNQQPITKKEEAQLMKSLNEFIPNSQQIKFTISPHINDQASFIAQKREDKKINQNPNLQYFYFDKICAKEILHLLEFFITNKDFEKHKRKYQFILLKIISLFSGGICTGNMFLNSFERHKIINLAKSKAIYKSDENVIHSIFNGATMYKNPSSFGAFSKKITNIEIIFNSIINSKIPQKELLFIKIIESLYSEKRIEYMKDIVLVLNNKGLDSFNNLLLTTTRYKRGSESAILCDTVLLSTKKMVNLFYKNIDIMPMKIQNFYGELMTNIITNYAPNIQSITNILKNLYKDSDGKLILDILNIANSQFNNTIIYYDNIDNIGYSRINLLTEIDNTIKVTGTKGRQGKYLNNMFHGFETIDMQNQNNLEDHFVAQNLFSMNGNMEVENNILERIKKQEFASLIQKRILRYGATDLEKKMMNITHRLERNRRRNY